MSSFEDGADCWRVERDVLSNSPQRRGSNRQRPNNSRVESNGRRPSRNNGRRRGKDFNNGYAGRYSPTSADVDSNRGSTSPSLEQSVMIKNKAGRPRPRQSRGDPALTYPRNDVRNISSPHRRRGYRGRDRSNQTGSTGGRRNNKEGRNNRSRNWSGRANQNTYSPKDYTTENAPFTMDDEDLNPLNDGFHIGIVSHWSYTFGFVVDKKTGEKYFLHAKNVYSLDRCCFLRKGMQIRFQAAVVQNGNDDTKRTSRHAIEATDLDGEPITFFKKHGETDKFTRDKLELGGKKRFQGVVESYYRNRGFGWVTPDAEFENFILELKDNEVKRHQGDVIYVSREDVLSEDFPPTLHHGMEISFCIYLDGQGYGAYDVKDKDGNPIRDTISDGDDCVYNGRVKAIKVNGFLFITPAPRHMKQLGLEPDQDIHAKCEDLNTDVRPAYVPVGTEVTFKLMQDEDGIHAVEINAIDGGPLAGEEYQGKNKLRTDCVIEATDVEGIVKEYRWGPGTGWIHPTTPLPTEIDLFLETQKSPGLLFFHHDDLISEDKIFGVTVGTPVKYNIYRQKGKDGGDDTYGAEKICNVDGTPLVNHKRPTKIVDKEDFVGVLSKVDDENSMIFIRHQGKMYEFYLSNCEYEKGFDYRIAANTKIEYTMERIEGQKEMTNVRFLSRQNRGARRRRRRARKNKAQNST